LGRQRRAASPVHPRAPRVGSLHPSAHIDGHGFGSHAWSHTRTPTQRQERLETRTRARI
jgi:hypothetical protein